MLKHALLIIVAAMALLSSCSKENDFISRRYPCRFHFYQQMHPTSLLFAAYRSPGTYVFVYTKMEVIKGISYRYVYVQSSSSSTPVERNRIETQVESNVPYLLGASNDVGLIIGCTNFNGPVAYDRTCPNCTGTYPLIWAESKTQVTCASCHRNYDLETGAISAGADGDPLMRYIVSLDNVRLNVSN